MTFGKFILTREITPRTANPRFVARLQAMPAIASVSRPADVCAAIELTPAEVHTVKSMWQNYRAQRRARDRRAS